MRNPNWTRDELILALDLYFRIDPSHTNSRNLEIVELSRLLDALPIHPTRPDPAGFRSPDAVYMKLCNLLRLDPDYGGTGLEAGSKLDQEVWECFASDRQHLAAVARAIKRCHQGLPRGQLLLPDEGFPEGSLLHTAHRLRETREPVVDRRRQAILQSSTALRCQGCEFSMEERYGLQVIDFHDLTPPWELEDPVAGVRPGDLAPVCPNCHRVLHLVRPWATGNLRGLLAALRA